jgi:CspA family cold shock protein
MEDVGGEDLTEGAEVEFGYRTGPKGPRVENVVRAQAASPSHRAT